MNKDDKLGKSQRDCGVRGEALNLTEKILNGSLIRENTVIGRKNLGLKKDRKWWENVMFGGKQKGLYTKRRAGIVGFDKNRVSENRMEQGGGDKEKTGWRK